MTEILPLGRRIDTMIRESLAIEYEDAKSAGMLGYMSRSLVQATLPHTDPKASYFERSNGIVTLSIIGKPAIGVPYGSVPRSLLAWICSEAVLTQSRDLQLGRSQSEFLGKLGMPNDGQYISSLKKQAHRLFSSMISLDGTRSTAENEIAKIVVPLVVGLLFVIVVLSSGGYLLQAVVEEKENRTIEIMVTSVSPNELMAGKIIGNLSVGLTQILFWALLAAVFVLVMGDRIPFLSDLQISWTSMLLSLLLLLPSFVFTAALMAILGATVTDSQEAAQVTGLITFPILIPYYFFSVLMMHPNGAFARALSYFPLSAPVAMTLRMAFTQVPAWELALVITMLILFSVLTVWLAGKAFRLGMLQYSKRIRLSQLFKKGGAL